MHIVGGIFKNRTLKTPKGQKTRPTTALLREAVFNILQFHIEEASFLDLFAGSGAIGFEAISRGAKKVFFVESNREAFLCLKENSELLGVSSQTTLLKTTSAKALETFKNNKTSFDLIYIDPPYGEMIWHGGEKKSLAIHALQTIFKEGLLNQSGYLFLEESEDTFKEDAIFEGLPLKERRKYGKSVLFIFQLIAK